MALVYKQSLTGCIAPRRVSLVRPSIVVRSSTQVETPSAPATSTASSSVVSLSSGEYEEFIAANELVLVDYYTECVAGGIREGEKRRAPV